IRDDRLTLPGLTAFAPEQFQKLRKSLPPRLAHDLRNAVGKMLRCNFQESTHLMGGKLVEIPLLSQKQIETDPGRYCRVLHTLYTARLLEKPCPPGIRQVQVAADGRVETTPPPAGVSPVRSSTGGAIHVGCRSADVADAATRPPLPCHPFDLRQDRLLAAGLDELPLVGGDGAEGAAAGTPPVRGY